MKNIKCLLAYAGTRYFGFQKTRHGPNIEEEVQKALEKILQHPARLQAASRTDKGVHAEGQVLNFFLQKEILLEKLHASLRSLLPKDISLLGLEEMPLSFHPTLHAKGKEYQYSICNGQSQLPFHREFSWHVPLPLDLEAMEKGAEILIGKRDFSALANLHYDNAVRSIDSMTIEPLPKNRYVFSIMGDNFLYKMVRNIVGTLVYIGLGKIALPDFPSILASGKRELAGVTAPAHGLCLKRVFY